jgi:RNA polymerase sigma-70 factor (ECF subfamily)
MTESEHHRPAQPQNAGQAALLRAVHDQHAQTLLRYVLRLTRGDMPFAEDVVQESLLRLWRKPEVLEQPSESVRVWLFTVARNLVIDDRRSARYVRELQTEVMPERASPDAIGPAFDALMTLSPDHRTAIVHAYYSARPSPTSRCMIPEGTVKSRLHYALRALRISLQEKGVVR